MAQNFLKKGKKTPKIISAQNFLHCILTGDSQIRHLNQSLHTLPHVAYVSHMPMIQEQLYIIFDYLSINAKKLTEIINMISTLTE